ncbi:MAG: hypothetical protein V4687_04580 [Bacteroidota bacterium]
MKKLFKPIKTLINLLKRPVVTYESVWLRLLVAFLVAQFIVNVGQHRHNYEFYTSFGYHRGWIISFIIAIIILQGIYWLNVYLDHKYPWAKEKQIRKKKQIVYGVVVPLLFDFLIMTAFFASLGYNIFKTQWPILYFPITLLLLAILNFYYYNRYKNHEDIKRKDRSSKQQTLKTQAENSVARLVTPSEEVVLYYKDDRRIMALISSGELIFTLFSAMKEIDLSSGKLMVPNRFCRVAWSNIKSVRKLGRQFEITLHLPAGPEPVLVSKEMSVEYRDRLNSLV